MGLKDQLFKWLTFKNHDGEELKLQYVLEGEPKNVEDLKKLFKAFGLESKFEKFLPLVRSKIDLELVPIPDDKIEVGQSKIGGNPDLDTGFEWPADQSNQSLSFIGQLNCAEISRHDSENLFPKEGLISFFYCANQEAWGFDPKDVGRFKVIYSESIDNLERSSFPIDLKPHSIFKSNKVKFEASLSLPGWEHDCIDGLLSDEETDDYIDMADGTENQILGYADCVQGPMELDCQLVTNGLYCGDPSGYNDPKRKELESGKDDWILLFQLDSEEDKTGMMWGDSGKLYYWIRKQDLRSKNFDGCWMILQCY